jgi:hypothetical protein
VLGDLDSLGAGFQLASHDLDIRGAGNLLGDEQSGHIRRSASSCTSRCWRKRFSVQRLQGTAKLRPDNKLVITRAWKDGAARLHAGLQLSKGLAKVAG